MMDLRVSSTRSVCVCTTIPSAAWVLHPIWGLGFFSMSTMQRRHCPAMLSPGW
jgi:hypothetical protein